MKTKFTLMALLLAGLTMPSLQAQETKTVKFPVTADTWIRESEPNGNKGDKDAVELGMDGETARAGLFAFDFKAEPGMKVKSATFHFITKLARQNNDMKTKIYAYDNDFEEMKATWNTEKDYYAAAIENDPLAAFDIKGQNGKALYNELSADYQSLEAWTNDVDVTSYFTDSNNEDHRVNFMMNYLNNASPQTRIYPKENNGESAYQYGAALTKEQLDAYLEVTFEAEATDSPDIYLLCGENTYGFFEEYLTDEYKFTQDEDDPNIYVLNSCPIVEEDFELINFKYGDQFLVPVDVDGDEIVTFTDNVYTSKFVISDDDFSGWTYYNWLGGEISVQLNFETMTIIIKKEKENEDILYLRGPFNNYDPAGNETWALNPVENDNGVYYGEFEILAGEFEFNLLSPFGVMIPGEVKSVEMSFDNNVFIGIVDTAYKPAEEAMTWSYPKWEGGVIAVTVDNNESGLTVKILDDYSAIKKIESVNGEDVIYNLQGVRVNNPVKGGIYVINGKKVILK